MGSIAFLGMGTMGGPMAGHIQARGLDLQVWSRSQDRLQQWSKRFGGATGDNARGVVKDRDIICMCLGRDEDVRSVVLEGPDAILTAMRPGSVLVDHTTTSAGLAVELGDACARHDIGFVDAPVSGGQSGAENGALTVMCGGSPVNYETARPVLDCYSRKHALMGDIGKGQLTKMVNQICIAGLVQALSEGIAFGEKAGLDMTQVIDVISKGAAQSWQMENRANTMIKRSFDFGFAVQWMIKDLKYALQEAKSLNSDTPITKHIYDYYQELAESGHSDMDTSALILRLNR